MYNTLHTHISKHIALTSDEFDRCKTYFRPKKVKKTHFLLQEGEICTDMAFVTKGSFRTYSVDDNAKEHIIQFYFEGWWVSDINSYIAGDPSDFFIEALEDSDVLLLSRAGYDAICEDIPKFDRLFRLLLQNHQIASYRRISASLSQSAEDRYLSLITNNPAITQRVAQRHIASFLGITPESLSRIRKQIAESK